MIIGIIFCIAVFMALWHLMMLIVHVMIGKFLIFSKFGMFRMIMQPDRTMKTVTAGFKKTIYHSSWLCVSCLVIAIIIM